MTLLRLLVLRAVLFPLAFLVPRRPGTWVFGAPGNGFFDNSKYLYLWMSSHRPDIRCVWLTGSRATRDMLRSHGLQAEHRWTLRGLVAGVTAAYHVVAWDGSDTCFSYTGGARVLNLWHGVGIKNIVRGASVGHTAQEFASRWRPDVYLRTMHHFRRPDLLLSTSPMMSEHFARCFDIPVERCPQLGYPRMDPSFDEDFRRLCLAFGDYGAWERLTAGRTVYLYAPTLRDDGGDLVAEALPDLAAVSEALRPTNGVLVLKMHPSTPPVSSEVLGELDNVVVWPDDLDLYPVLADVDCLITDYSSLLYDHIAVHDSGVVMYAFDYDKYLAKDRDLAFPFAESVVGERADTFDELCEALRSGAALAPLPAERLADLRLRFWGSTERPQRLASEAVADFATRWLAEHGQPGPAAAVGTGRRDDRPAPSAGAGGRP